MSEPCKEASYEKCDNPFCPTHMAHTYQFAKVYARRLTDNDLITELTDCCRDSEGSIAGTAMDSEVKIGLLLAAADRIAEYEQVFKEATGYTLHGYIDMKYEVSRDGL